VVESRRNWFTIISFLGLFNRPRWLFMPFYQRASVLWFAKYWQPVVVYTREERCFSQNTSRNSGDCFHFLSLWIWCFLLHWETRTCNCMWKGLQRFIGYRCAVFLGLCLFIFNSYCMTHVAFSVGVLDAHFTELLPRYFHPSFAGISPPPRLFPLFPVLLFPFFVFRLSIFSIFCVHFLTASCCCLFLSLPNSY
jgi:hypothetical protein